MKVLFATAITYILVLFSSPTLGLKNLKIQYILDILNLLGCVLMKLNLMNENNSTICKL